MLQSTASEPRLPGQPPPTFSHSHQGSSELDMLSARLRLLERSFLALDTSRDGGGAAAAVSSMPMRPVQNHHPLLANPGPAGGSSRDASSPASEIIRIFHHAHPDVQLAPVTNPLASVPNSRPYRLNFLLPSQLRAMAACALQRPVYNFKVSQSSKDDSATKHGPSTGHAAPAA